MDNKEKKELGGVAINKLQERKKFLLDNPITICVNLEPAVLLDNICVGNHYMVTHIDYSEKRITFSYCG